MEETIYAHEYIHTASIGDRKACMRVLRETGAMLERGYVDGPYRGHQVYLIASEADRTMNYLEADVGPFTGGKYPYVYAFVQPKDRDAEALVDPMMAPLGYARVA